MTHSSNHHSTVHRTRLLRFPELIQVNLPIALPSIMISQKPASVTYSGLGSNRGGHSFPHKGAAEPCVALCAGD